MRAFITSSSVTSLRYCEYGFLVACLCDFTEIFAKCSSLVPYLRICSMPAWPNTAGIRPEPIRPSVAYAGSDPPPPPPSRPCLPLCSAPARHCDAVHPRPHRHVRFGKRGRVGRACVGDVDHRNTGLANLLKDPLPDHRIGLIEVAGREHLDVLDIDPGVLDRFQR